MLGFSDIYRCMTDVSEMPGTTLADLGQLLSDYPYFHTARLLYLKKLSQSDRQDVFTSELQRISPGVADRKRLFSLVEGERYGLSLFDVYGHGTLKNDAFSLIDAFLADMQEAEGKDEAEGAVRVQPAAATDYFHAERQGEDAVTGSDTEVKLNHQNLIDSFIEEDAHRAPGSGLRLKPGGKNAAHTPAAKGKDASKPLFNTYFTETLARIYIKQKRYDKALQIIKNLSLKYPEKSIYFADQIRFLEKLIINSKK